jgi:hypothetical protein
MRLGHLSKETARATVHRRVPRENSFHTNRNPLSQVNDHRRHVLTPRFVRHDRGCPGSRSAHPITDYLTTSNSGIRDLVINQRDLTPNENPFDAPMWAALRCAVD